MSVIAYILFAVTALVLAVWIVHQLFLYDKHSKTEPNPLFGLIDKALPYLLLACFIQLIFLIRQGINFDFNYILVPATLFFLLVYVLDKTVYHDRKTHGKGHERPLIASAYDFLPVLAVVLIIRSFLLEPFNIPSSSMVPSLYTGDYVAVNKFAYGLRLPITNTEFWDIGDPERGDVAVFRYPEDPSLHYIKRVIGLPGDTVSHVDGALYINGEPVPSEQVAFTADTAMVEQMYQPDASRNMNAEMAVFQGQAEEGVARYERQTIGEHQFLRRHLASEPDHQQYAKFLQANVGYQDNWQVTVPADSYFVLGDNTDRSGDSRFWGMVPDANLSGKAFYVWMHKKPGLHLPTFAYNRKID